MECTEFYLDVQEIMFSFLKMKTHIPLQLTIKTFFSGFRPTAAELLRHKFFQKAKVGHSNLFHVFR